MKKQLKELKKHIRRIKATSQLRWAMQHSKKTLRLNIPIIHIKPTALTKQQIKKLKELANSDSEKYFMPPDSLKVHFLNW